MFHTKLFLQNTCTYCTVYVVSQVIKVGDANGIEINQISYLWFNKGKGVTGSKGFEKKILRYHLFDWLLLISFFNCFIYFVTLVTT